MKDNWTLGEKLEEKHFKGTFVFPDDIDFLGEVTRCQFFCDVFNDIVSKRIKTNANGETITESK